MQKTVLIFLLLVSATALKGQQDTILLGEVSVKDSVKQIVLDKVFLRAKDNTLQSQNLAELLQRYPGFFVKSYAPGLLASPSFRGTGANHTIVTWEGFNLQSSMNGQLDLSLVPTELFSETAVTTGVGSTRYGSGAIGGTVELNSADDFAKNNLISAKVVAGSFGLHQENLTLGKSGKRASFQIGLFNREVHNDYTFNNRAKAGKPEEKLRNAYCRQQGYLAQGAFNIKGWKLRIRNWQQVNDRQIPPIMPVSRGEATQWDQFNRSVAVLEKTFGRHRVSLRQAAFFEVLNYDDALINLHSTNKTRSYISELSDEWQQKRNAFKLLLNYTRQEAEASGYGTNKPVQDRFALFAEWKRDSIGNLPLEITAGAREEMVNGKAIEPAASLVAQYRKKNFTGLLKGARVYRIPNFNDLYWKPGGNPVISPEYGWTSEAGVSYQKYNTRHFTSFGLSGFANVINNWIIWLPENGLWTPQNLARVFARGGEANVKYLFQINSAAYIRIKYGTSLTWSGNTKEKTAGDASVGKQLIYVPFQRHTGELLFEWKAFNFVMQGEYTGFRYTSSDNTSSLPGYWLADFNLSYRIKGKSAWEVSAGIKNIFNTAYEVMEYRPMPGRHYQASISYTFNKSKEHEK